MKIVQTAIPGCCVIECPVSADARGRFVKIFHRDRFAEQQLQTDFPEEYYSVSRRGVLRGLHFQLPPHEHVKLVLCLQGEVLDAVVDLRLGSPSFGGHVLLELSGGQAGMVCIPPGLAHGFYVRSEEATMLYKTSSVYAPEHDSGIRWDSAGIPWPDMSPVISERDSRLPRLADFQSPFRFAAERPPHGQ